MTTGARPVQNRAWLRLNDGFIILTTLVILLLPLFIHGFLTPDWALLTIGVAAIALAGELFVLFPFMRLPIKS